jgi:phospholipase/carboxylesterase
MPLFIAMHGAGGSGSNWLNYPARAEERGMIFLAPDSRSSTWDLIKGGYGADLQFLDQALGYVFNRCNIDPTRITLAGFSDGTTYALSLGMSNGDFFSHLIGYSPGFVVGEDPIVGRPRIIYRMENGIKS